MKIPITLVRKYISKPKLLRFYVVAREQGKDNAGYFDSLPGFKKSTYYRLKAQCEEKGLITGNKIVAFRGRKYPVSDFFIQDDKLFQAYLFCLVGRLHAEYEHKLTYKTDRHGVRMANRRKTTGLASNESEVSVSYLSELTGLSVGKIVELKRIAKKYKILSVRQRQIKTPEGVYSKKGGYCYNQLTDILTFKIPLK